MKYFSAAILLFEMMAGCGAIKDQVKNTSNDDRDPCRIELKFSGAGDIGDSTLLTYSGSGYPKACFAYNGENIHALNMKIQVDSEASLGSLSELTLGYHQVGVSQYDLSKGSISIESVDLSRVDGGPFQLETWSTVSLTFMFPKETEIALFPKRVELVVNI